MRAPVGQTGWLLVSTAFVFFMVIGLAFFYGGLVRRKNALNTMMMSFVALGIVGITWSLFGYSFAYADGNGFIGGLTYLFLNNIGTGQGGWFIKVPNSKGDVAGRFVASGHFDADGQTDILYTEGPLAAPNSPDTVVAWTFSGGKRELWRRQLRGYSIRSTVQSKAVPSLDTATARTGYTPSAASGGRRTANASRWLSPCRSSAN